MDQQQTIFDKDFDRQISPRRRDIMPMWLIIYMWCIIVFSIIFFIWSAFFAPDYGASDPKALDPQTSAGYRLGILIGKFVPTAMFALMGLLVWLEAKWAIRYNWVFASVWILLIVYAILLSGLRGLFAGMLMPVFIPYWTGLFLIQRKWEKEAVSGRSLR